MKDACRGECVEGFSERDLGEGRCQSLERGIDDELVFFRLNGAGGVEEPSAGAKGVERVGENFLLARGLLGE